MSIRPALLLAALTVAAFPANAAPLGDECRAGNMASCEALCARGMSKACARMGGGGPDRNMVEFGEQSEEELRARGLLPTGLKPVFPKDAICTPIASPFAARTRYDGSARSPRANFGYHGGIDLSLNTGTPIVAIADGTVINLREGGLLVGIEVFLRHAPEDTGLGVWTFSKYKHFMKMPELRVGQTVRAGETLGQSGNSGTVGGYYGARGYPHLHLSVYMNGTGAYSADGGNVAIEDGRHVDPVALFRGGPLVSSEAAALPPEAKAVRIPYVTANGRTYPEGSRTVWPVACRRR